jgi:hypothetical protein
MPPMFAHRAAFSLCRDLLRLLGLKVAQDALTEGVDDNTLVDAQFSQGNDVACRTLNMASELCLRQPARLAAICYRLAALREINEGNGLAVKVLFAGLRHGRCSFLVAMYAV